MKLSYVMIVSALVSVIVGIVFVLAPGSILAMIGAMGGVAGLIIQLFGGVLIGYAVLNWSARNAQDGDALRAIVLANFVFNTINFILVVYAFVSGSLLLNIPVLASMIVPLLLALGSGYYQFARPNRSRSFANVRQ